MFLHDVLFKTQTFKLLSALPQRSDKDNCGEQSLVQECTDLHPEPNMDPLIFQTVSYLLFLLDPP